MALAISTNFDLSTILVQRAIALRNLEIFRSSERIATGKRINRAADDIGGMSQVQRHNARLRGLMGAITNTQNGLSLVETASDSTKSILDILNDIKTKIAEANGATLSQSDRANIRVQINSLVNQIGTLITASTFNGQTLLDGTAATAISAVSAVSSNTSKLTIFQATGDYTGSPDALAVSLTTQPQRAYIVAQKPFTAANETLTISLTVRDVNGVVASYTTPVINMTSSDTAANAVAKINSAMAQVGMPAQAFVGDGVKTADDGTTVFETNRIVIMTTEYGSGAGASAGATAFSFTGGSSTLGVASTTTFGANAAGTIGGTAFTGNGKRMSATILGASLIVDAVAQTPGTALSASTPFTLGYVGIAKYGLREKTFNVYAVPDNTSPADITLTTFNLGTGATDLNIASIGTDTAFETSLAGRDKASAQVELAITRATGGQTRMASDENVLNAHLTFLQNQETKVQETISQIEDADVAAETTRLLSLRVAQEIAAALLAQINLDRQRVFELLVLTPLSQAA